MAQLHNRLRVTEFFQARFLTDYCYAGSNLLMNTMADADASLGAMSDTSGYDVSHFSLGIGYFLQNSENPNCRAMVRAKYGGARGGLRVWLNLEDMTDISFSEYETFYASHGES